jgi:2-dehydropantoate 2-reductase
LKVCVFGAGAIGGHLAARLAHGGADVSIVARGAHLAAIQANGLKLISPDLNITAPVHATDDPATLGPQDAVLVTVKAPALPSVAAAIAPLLRPDTVVVFVINGIPWWYFDKAGDNLAKLRMPELDPGGALRHAVGVERTLGGVVYSACEVIAPGVVEVESARNRLVIGELDGTVSSRAEALAAPLRAGGFGIEISGEIRTAVWTKLLMNMAGSPIAVLTTSPPMVNYTEPAVEKAIRAIYAEGEQVARALGCAPVVDIEASVSGGRKLAHRPSMLQDLELGRPMEIATILDAPLALARLTGIETPTLDLIVALARLRAKAAGLAGQSSQVG